NPWAYHSSFGLGARMSAEQGNPKTMTCPACRAEVAADGARCTACGHLFGRRRRRRGGATDTDTPFSPKTTVHNRPALRAYRIGVLAIVPGIGLIAGPLALILGVIARRRGRA